METRQPEAMQTVTRAMIQVEMIRGNLPDDEIGIVNVYCVGDLDSLFSVEDVFLRGFSLVIDEYEREDEGEESNVLVSHQNKAVHPRSYPPDVRKRLDRKIEVESEVFATLFDMFIESHDSVADRLERELYNDASEERDDSDDVVSVHVYQLKRPPTVEQIEKILRDASANSRKQKGGGE